MVAIAFKKVSFYCEALTSLNVVNVEIMPEILEKLFRSKAEVKLLRLFLNNPDEKYLVSETAKKLKISSALARREINNLAKIGFLVPKKKLKKTYYCVDRNFVLCDELRKLIFKVTPTSYDKIKSQAVKLGNVKLVLISGILINSDKGGVDIVIVGEHISNSKLRSFLSSIEAETGKEIRYVCMSPDEFRYRRNMFDKFIISILEGPHKVLINRLKKV